MSPLITPADRIFVAEAVVTVGRTEREQRQVVPVVGAQALPQDAGRDLTNTTVTAEVTHVLA